jgi:hypothetical protein
MSKLRADCSSCCGLCCVVPGQLSVQGFGADKPAETPCPHLNDDHRCAIYAKRRTLGYAACEAFDCFGAGQWVTQHLFGGAKWNDAPELASRMFAAYRRWLPRFRAAALIEAALPHVRDDARSSLFARIAELTSGDTGKDLAELDELRLRAETLALIQEALRRDNATA